MKLRFVLVLALLACTKKGVVDDHDAGPMPLPVAPVTAATPVPTATTTPTATMAVATPIPAGAPPPDGKYERVLVDGITVPMIEVMDHGATVLVDTDGKKPRSWEEQYKRKRPELKPGEYDLHKTNTNKNDRFDDDPIDREGRWVIDAKGNISKG